MAMIISLFMPLALLTCLEYFVLFSFADENGKLANSATILLAGLAYLSVFRNSIPLSPRLTLGDTYVISILITVLWTIIDVFCFKRIVG
jgi:hypothetical protein